MISLDESCFSIVWMLQFSLNPFLSLKLMFWAYKKTLPKPVASHLKPQANTSCLLCELNHNKCLQEQEILLLSADFHCFLRTVCSCSGHFFSPDWSIHTVLQTYLALNSRLSLDVVLYIDVIDDKMDIDDTFTILPSQPLTLPLLAAEQHVIRWHDMFE